MYIFSVLSFPILSATVNEDHMVAFHDELDTSDAPFTNEVAGGAVGVQAPELSHYRYDEG